MVEHQRGRAGLEITLLVEDAVIGQMLLGVLADHPAVARHAGHIEQTADGPKRIAQDQGDPATLGTDPFQGRLDPLHQLGAQQEILRRIAGEGQLRKDQQVDPVGARSSRLGDHPIGVADDIPDDEIQLRDPNTTSHGGVLLYMIGSVFRQASAGRRLYSKGQRLIAGGWRPSSPPRQPPSSSASRLPISAGERTVTAPACSRAAYLPSAVPRPPVTIAPACPMRLPAGAVTPAM